MSIVITISLATQDTVYCTLSNLVEY